MTTRVLIVEDDQDLSDSLQRYLRRAGLSVHAVADALTLNEELAGGRFDIVVLDVNLPGAVDGFAAAAGVRANSAAGIVMLTGRAMRDDRLHGLSLGADHYLVKPVDPAELTLVIRNLHLRLRGLKPEMPAPEAAVQGWIFDAGRWSLTAPTGVTMALTAVEYHLIDRLVARAGEPVDRDELLGELDRRSEGTSTRGLDLMIFRLRRRVERTCGCRLPLIAVRGVGYVFAEPVTRQ